MGFEPTTLRDLVGCSNHWATGDSMASKGVTWVFDWNRIVLIIVWFKGAAVIELRENHNMVPKFIFFNFFFILFILPHKQENYEKINNTNQYTRK